MRIFLADLGHNQITLSSDVYPLGIASLAAYLSAHLKGRDAVQVALFREPEDLQAALAAAPPDLLGLSSYAWNHNLSVAFARHARVVSPRTLIVMGGPNFPLTPEEQETFLRGLPSIDVAVRGPTYEGERAFLNLVQRFAEVGQQREGLLAEPIPGNLWIDPATQELVRGPDVERIRDLDEVPSPYLMGLLDSFLPTGYFPILQIARGCPFHCTFCNSGVAANNRVFAHSVERIKAELQYLAERVRPERPLCFADDNFGMYAWDEEVADFIRHLQDRYQWPRYIRTTTGKNRGERIIEVMRKVRGSLPMTAAVQSLNPQVLANIERANISLETFSDIQREVRAQGMQSYGELILCLPGETKASFMKAIRELLAAGVQRISAHQLMLLHGASLSNPESRQRFGFQTRFRVVARNLGRYLGEPVVETEEVVVATPTFSFADYLDTRTFHLLLTTFYYEGNFAEAFAFAEEHGLKPFDLVQRLYDLLGQAPAAFQHLIEDFRRESEEELFPTEAACQEWAREHFEELRTGQLGGNLLSKYAMLGRFYLTAEALDFLEAGIAAELGQAADDEVASQLWAVMQYLRGVLLHVPFAESLAAAPSWDSAYDVEAWVREGYRKPLQAYRCRRPIRFTTTIEEPVRQLLADRLATFGEHPAGLGKFTRTLFARQLRRTVVRTQTAVVPVAGGCP